jgi:hypothetical protein
MELSNFHFVDNLNRAILQCGVILCDLIPKIYDTPREVRILGPDLQETIVKVNQQFADDYNQPKCYDLANGKYDVRLKIGPSFKTQRQETAAQVAQLAQNFPQLMQVAGDIVFENLDFAGADQIADRLRRAMPPNLTEDPGKKPAELLAQQNQQQAQQIEQMTQALNKLSDDVRAKRIESESQQQIEQMKIESSDRQAAIRAQVDLVKLEASLTSAEDIQILRSQVTLLQAQVAAMASGAAAEAAERPEPGEGMAGPGMAPMGGPMGGPAARCSAAAGVRMTSKPVIEDYAGLVAFNEALLDWLLDERERKGKVSRQRRIETLMRENADLLLENAELKRQLSAVHKFDLCQTK